MTVYERPEDPEAIAARKKAAAGKKIKRTIKRVLISMFISWVVTVVVLTIGFKYYLAPMLKSRFETQGSIALGAPLKIGALSIGVVPTLMVKLAKVEFEVPAANFKGSVEKARAELGASLLEVVKGGPLGVVIFDLERPIFELSLPAMPTDSAADPSSTGAPASDQSLIPRIHVGRDVGVRLRINNGTVHVTRPPDGEITLNQLHFDLSVPNVNSFEADVNAQADVGGSYKGTNLKFPLDISTHAALSGNELTIANAKGQLLGFAFAASGRQDLSHGGGEWRVTGQVPELANVPVPPSFLPAGKWSGKMAFSVEASADSRDTGWKAHAHADITQLKGNTKFEKNGWVADGTLAGNGGVEVFLAPMPLKSYEVQIKTGYAALDLTGMSVENGAYLKKPKVVPLVVSFVGDGNLKSLRVEKLDLKFANLSLKSHGQVALEPGQLTALSMVVERTDLAGWQAYFPMLEKSPLTGFLQLNADVRGDWNKPESFIVRLNPLLLENLSGVVNWRAKDGLTSAAGPFKANARLDLNALGTELRGAVLKMDANFTDLALSSPGNFEKKTGVPLTLSLSGRQQAAGGDQIELKSSAIHLGSSVFDLTGRVSQPQRPRLNLRLSAPAMNLAELTQLSPKFAASGISGSATCALEINGTYDFKLGFTQSPLHLSGNLSARLPSIKIPRGPSTAGGAAPSGPAPVAPAAHAPPEPLLPDWPIAKSMSARLDLTVGELFYGDLSLKGVRLLSTLNQGDLNGSVQIDHLFDGAVRVPRFHARIAVARPVSSADVEFTSLNLQTAATFASPDWHELIKGSGTGKLRASIPHPDANGFAEQVQATGTITVKDGFLSSARLDQAINESVAKIPGIGGRPLANGKGVTADIGADFTIAKKIATLSRFTFSTPEKNELRATGTIGFDKAVDLTGTAYLATAPVGGSVRAANSDAQGRFVVPLKIKGNLLKPEIAFAQETIVQLAKNTATAELKKGAQQKVDQLQQRVKEKGLDGLKEGLKDLFK